MKKALFVICCSLFFINSNAYSQIWVEVFGVQSFPSKDIFGSGVITVAQEAAVTNLNATEIKESELFKTLADPSFGIGFNCRYAKSKKVLGIELSYVKYKKASNLLDIRTFRIGPFLEYYFRTDKKLLPYVGGEFSLQQSRVSFNRNIVDQIRISDTNVGVGPRLGLVYNFNNKWSTRLGTKYVFTKDLPYYDVMLGVAFNLGDF